MKKILKVLLCFVVAFGATFGLVACDKEEIKENVEIGTEAAIEKSASIIPVEYRKETAEGIYKNALQKLLSSNKVQIKGTDYYLENGMYIEKESEQTTMIKDGKRYLYYDIAGLDKSVLGTYGEKLVVIDLADKTYIDATPVSDPDPEPGTATIVNAAVQALMKLDLIESMVRLSDHVVSGRYFDGATYINVKFEDTDSVSNVEIKIVDGKIVGFESLIAHTDGTGWANVAITYGDAVDVSMIPTTLDGYTVAA